MVTFSLYYKEYLFRRPTMEFLADINVNEFMMLHISDNVMLLLKRLGVHLLLFSHILKSHTIFVSIFAFYKPSKLLVNIVPPEKEFITLLIHFVCGCSSNHL